MRAGCCIHFRGFQHETCEAGIRWMNHTPEPSRRDGCALRAPCWKKHEGFNSPEQKAEIAKAGTCPNYREPTAEELAAYERRIEAESARFRKVMPLVIAVKREHAGKSWSGTKPCPVCGGTLHLSHSGYNGHVHGRCETKDCLNWME